MRQVDEIHQSERHRQAHRQHEKKHPEGEAVEQHDGDLADHDPPSPFGIGPPCRRHRYHEAARPAQSSCGGLAYLAWPCSGSLTSGISSTMTFCSLPSTSWTSRM